jgi:hypothetical protein
VFCFYGTSVYDEGGYLYEGWLMVAHDLTPYRDLYTKTTPLIFYLYGWGQHLLGPGLLVGRVQACAMALLGLLLAVATARRLGGKWAAVLTAWLFATSLAAHSHYYHAFAIAPASLFVALTAYLLIVPRPGPVPLLGAALSATAIFLCRHDLIFISAVAWLYLLLVYPLPLRWRLGSWGLSLLAILGLMIPLYLGDPLAFLYMMSAGSIGPKIVAPASYGEATSASLHSLAWHVMIFLRYYAGTWLLLLPALAGGLVAWRAPGWARHHAPWLLLGGMAAANWLGHLLAALALGLNIFYLLDFYIFFPLTTLAAAAFGRLLSAQTEPLNRVRWATVAGLAIVLCPVLTGPGPHLQISLSRPTVLEQVRLGGEFLARHTTPEDVIFTLDDPQQFLEARRLMIPELTHELFSYRESDQTEDLARVRLFNDDHIRQWLSGQATVAVMSEGTWRWMATTDRYPGGQRLHDLVRKLLDDNYELVAEEPGGYSGPTRLYRLRPDREGHRPAHAETQSQTPTQHGLRGAP